KRLACWNTPSTSPGQKVTFQQSHGRTPIHAVFAGYAANLGWPGHMRKSSSEERTSTDCRCGWQTAPFTMAGHAGAPAMEMEKHECARVWLYGMRCITVYLHRLRVLYLQSVRQRR